MYYILDGKKAIKIQDIFICGKCLEIKNRRVADTRKGDIRVSTVFLGIAHAFNGGPPMLFETMIFGGEHDQYQDRYSTWEDAENGHEKACILAGIK